MKISTQNILTFLTNCEAGTQIPGALPGRNFKFIGLKLYLGKGAYSHLHGTDVVVIESGKRRGKRHLITLFSDWISYVGLLIFGFNAILG